MNDTVPVEGLRSRKKREMRERLVVCARTLFSAHGFESTTIEAIANMANVSKPTVFNYFASKAALLHELVLRADKGFAQVVDQVMEDNVGAVQQLENFFLGLAVLTRQNPALTRLLMVEAVKSMDTEDNVALPHRFIRTEKALIRLLREGVKKGEVRDDYSVQLLAQLTIGAYTNILLLWLADSEYKVELKLKQSARFLGEAMLAK